MSSFLDDVEAFLEKHQMAPTAFGVGALNDRHFVRQLRAGRRTWSETEEKVRGFMADYEASSSGAPNSEPAERGSTRQTDQMSGCGEYRTHGADSAVDDVLPEEQAA